MSTPGCSTLRALARAARLSRSARSTAPPPAPPPSRALDPTRRVHHHASWSRLPADRASPSAPAAPWWQHAPSLAFARRGVFGVSSPNAPPDADQERGPEEAEESAPRPTSHYDMANKPRKGINAWKRARKKAAFIKANASAHRENRKARAAEREQKRLERWRDLAATQRAWEAAKAAEAREAATAARDAGAPPPLR
jgi:hypothetical protein